MPSTEVEIGYDGLGRPMILKPAEAMFCSVSARGELAALALSPHPVGVDIEPLDPGDIPWAAFAREEAADLRVLPATERLAGSLRLWTLKEAFLKARGSGLLHDPAEVVVSGTGLRFGAETMPLAPSVLRQTSVGGKPLVAACIALAAPGAEGATRACSS